ncbi:MAG: tRNA uridine-5-carboxymethylaminomethyl(34) synthesis enzyme MnmG [Bacteroidota bacterium]
MSINKYDIIVIGAGHAGIESSFVSSVMGCKTALITMNLSTIGMPSCNPSIGGTAKGHLVKEIDALGGVMGYLADKAGIQFKMLNKSKGPAIWSPRAQIDKDLYPVCAYNLLKSTKNLTMIEGTVLEVLIKNSKVYGVKLLSNEILYSTAVVFCPGTFLNGVLYTGNETSHGGRFGEKPSEIVSDKLAQNGFEKGRLKTGTPPRILSTSIDYSKLDTHPGDLHPKPFSFRSHKVENKIMCYATETNRQTHDILRTGFDRSPMFSGLILGTGPRYCPSIEDKIVRFSDRDSHKIVLEPEGLNTDSVYMNGFSSSLPADIQEKGIRTIRGLENAEIVRYAYAIEYDFFYPYQLKFTLESKLVENLFLAGQINGTSGYEEAASQGLIAGINAAHKILGLPEFYLKRSDAYIGVLIDDLVNKSTDEPYRIFTSSAEYRLLLRQDNAPERLSQYGFDLGLISKKINNNNIQKTEDIKSLIEFSKLYKIKPEILNIYLEKKLENPITESTDIYSIAKRANCFLNEIFTLVNDIPDNINNIIKQIDIVNQVHIEIKYEGYIKRQLKEVNYFLENEKKRIPANFDYSRLNSISKEARDKLEKVKPASLGQAERIQGVAASDISILALMLK